MVKLQYLTGCRPAEVRLIRPCDVDTSGEVWVYSPPSHKAEHHGRERRIYVGPAAQKVLAPWLNRPATTFCFSPAEAARETNARRRAERRRPMTPSQAKRKPKVRRKRAPGVCYGRNSYHHAITRACWRASIAGWAPNRLRHSRATEPRTSQKIRAGSCPDRPGARPGGRDAGLRRTGFRSGASDHGVNRVRVVEQSRLFWVVPSLADGTV